MVPIVSNKFPWASLTERFESYWLHFQNTREGLVQAPERSQALSCRVVTREVIERSLTILLLEKLRQMRQTPDCRAV